MKTSKNSISRFLALVFAWAILVSPALATSSTSPGLTDQEMQELLKTIDDRQGNSGDYRAKAIINQREVGKDDVLYESVIYRRDEDDKLMILFLAPKTEAGKGYLRIDDNLWLYDPTVGKWERRTERERIGGTDSNRADFDESRLSEEYDPTYLGSDKLGKFDVHHIKLDVKEGVDVAYPIAEIWVDKESSNILKRQDYALSGRLMRRSLYPQWEKIFSEAEQDWFYYPRRILIFDEVETANQTEIRLNNVDLTPLDANMFTKAWLESKSR